MTRLHAGPGRRAFEEEETVAAVLTVGTVGTAGPVRALGEVLTDKYMQWLASIHLEPAVCDVAGSTSTPFHHGTPQPARVGPGTSTQPRPTR